MNTLIFKVSSSATTINQNWTLDLEIKDKIELSDELKANEKAFYEDLIEKRLSPEKKIDDTVREKIETGNDFERKHISKHYSKKI